MPCPKSKMFSSLCFSISYIPGALGPVVKNPNSLTCWRFDFPDSQGSQGSSFTKFRSFRAPGALGANHARTPFHLASRQILQQLWRLNCLGPVAQFLYFRSFRVSSKVHHQRFICHLELFPQVNLGIDTNQMLCRQPRHWLSISCWASSTQMQQESHKHNLGAYVAYVGWAHNVFTKVKSHNL